LPSSSRRGGFFRAWLPVLAYVVLIFVFSSQPRLAPPFRFENGDKLAHTLEYGGLGFLLVRALRIGPRAMGPLAGGLAALAIGMAVGAADELYQGVVPGRQSTVHDWLADTGGLILAQLAYLAIRRE
jgi:VanZ family protein